MRLEALEIVPFVGTDKFPVSDDEVQHNGPYYRRFRAEHHGLLQLVRFSVQNAVLRIVTVMNRSVSVRFLEPDRSADNRTAGMVFNHWGSRTANVAAGKRINKAAFSVTAGSVQGNLGRNTLNGFGTTQVDLTLRRQFRLYERVSLQARADFFNIFNHPNFGQPTNYLSSPLFGQATQMLGTSLGSGGQNGGLNPLYQIGGPRSTQLALKLVF